MNIQKFTRKPLDVDAVRVDAENITDVAEWCGGKVVTIEPEPGTEPEQYMKAKQYIKVKVIHPMNKMQQQAHIGDWVLKSAHGFKIFSNSTFTRGFVRVPPAGEQLENNDLEFKGLPQ